MLRRLLIFALLGPPVGGLTFLSCFLIDKAVQGGAGPALFRFPEQLLLTLVLSYPFGFLPALIAGLIVSSFAGQLPLRAEAASVAVVGFFIGLFYGFYWTNGRPGASGALLIFTLICFVPTMVCWFLARRAAQKTMGAP